MKTKRLFPLSLAMADYDRTRPLLDGRVKPEGLELKLTTASIPEFCLKPVYEEYDAAEMSLSWYLAAHSRGEPVIALPVFPLRMPVLAYVYTRSDAPYAGPKELVGKRIGTKRYRSTINVWLRGILKEHYSIEPNDFAWITPAEEVAGYKPPAGVSVTVRPGEMKDIEELLFRGEIEAIFTPVTPEAVKRGDKRIRRLFPDCKAVCEAYFSRTGYLPMTHTIVMNKALYEKEPWIAERLFSAFREAQRVCLDFYRADPKHLCFSGAVFALEEESRIYGSDAWAHGLLANRSALSTFARYAHEQGYIPRIPALEELFAGNTISL